MGTNPIASKVNPLAVGTIYGRSPSVIRYLLERFRKVHITTRPQHLMAAYEAVVVCRVLYPHVWQSLEEGTLRQVYQKFV